jgi:regulator of protease activity HflC (stomatin/prohibitin superfamily)
MVTELALVALQASGIGVVPIIVIVAIIVFVGIFLLTSTIKILKEYERGVVFRLGRVYGDGAKGPGLFLLVPFVNRVVKVDLRTVTMDVPPQDVITRDNVPARVTAVIYFRVVDPNKSVIEVENFVQATSQTTLRSVLGKKDLDDLLANREAINAELQTIIDEQTEPERRAKIIAAVGEYQASERLRQAADRLDSPTALQLRLFQTMAEIATEQNSTIVLPIPLDLFGPFIEKTTAKGNGHVIPSLLDKLVGSSDQQSAEKKEEQGVSVG